MTKLLLGILFTVCIAGCGANEEPVVEEAGESLTGGLDIDAYCKRTYGSSAWAGVVGNNAYSWVCVAGNQQYPVDAGVMQTICVQQYGTNAKAVLGDPNNLYSWSCTYGCNTNSDCGRGGGFYCKKPSGQCSAVGQCAAVPTGLCGSLGGNVTVCGCNGNTYPSPCFAAKAGTNVKHGGKCP
jgi:hypothetical protein